MNRKSLTHRCPGRRAAAAAALVLAVGLGVSTQMSAQAADHTPAKMPAQATLQAAAQAAAAPGSDVQAAAQLPAAAPGSVGGTSGQAVTRVADFYGAYIDAKGDYEDPDRALATALRKHYLTPDLATRLATWEESNGVDGVLHAQNVPARWTVTDNGAVGNGHEVIVTLTYGSGDTTRKTKLFVLLERYNHIADITTTSNH
ncbi:hypothetical protein OG689_39705 [Kitasatospora sp. NBC_00240]|uniref:hypothetical protein n=1 Tax=Kitasatospora sp. NBC_00240 TaxID=2903567 RepID=UPI00225AEDF7|nr:hypothetical protein [Kitasatospora sp. NBC_00240]MCX5215309.1 hypothetical protein [Kitasatospora sp. NBC_00240]